MRLLQASPEQQAAIDRILSGQVSLDPIALRAAGAAAGAPAAEPFITKAELGKRLNRDVRTMTTWMRRGLLPSVTNVLGVINRPELVEWKMPIR